MAYDHNRSMAYDHDLKGGNQPPQGPEVEISHLEGGLRGLLVGSSPDTQTPPQRHAQIAGQPLPPGFSTKSPHKRLNQKERRLLAAQLTVPVTERVSVSAISTESIMAAVPLQGRPAHQSNASWHQPAPRVPQQHHQAFPQRQSTNEPFHPQQHQSHFNRQSIPPTLAQHRGPDAFRQGPQQQPQQWMRPQSGLPQNVRPPNQYQQTRQWQAPQVPPSSQAPAFQDVQFQHQRPPPPPTRQLYHPGSGPQNAAPAVKPDMLIAQCEFLESLLHAIVPDVGVEDSEIAEKEAFRQEVEHICRDAITKYEKEIGNNNFVPESVALRCFGSTASGFATKASDMDLALLTPLSHITGDSADSPIPRVMEKALLDHGYGARLLTRTRVPIIKLCQKPPPMLRAELLKERLRWENGAHEALEDEETIDEDDPEGGTESPPEVIEVSAKDIPVTSNPAEKVNAIITEYQQTICSLVQKTEKKTLSLGDYYGKAKSVLHCLGGRDAGMNGSHALNPKEVDVLEDVCEQFIKGLENSSIKEKLLGTTVIQAIINRECDGHTVRSLSSLHNLVEGETLLAAWDSRPLPERNAHLEQSCEAHIHAWNRLLLNSPNLKDYSANYNKLVFQFLCKIRSMSSLQLVFLRQSPTETAAQYYARADHIRKDLNVADGHTGSNVPISIVVSHYINGIHNSANIRAALETLRGKASLTLRHIGTYHQILELIRDYEKALDKKNNYPESDRADIEAYVSLLRSSISTPNADKLVLPLSAEFQPLIRKVASLPSPRDVARQNDRFQSHLEFPKSGVGIQCDINFAASLALHNTQLLRCYCAADPRVKPMVLFIKHWAKRRGINNPYRGTLSSYGYVLMVLHYLMNIADPFVVPNLQHLGGELPPHLSPAEREALTVCEGRDVRFWRNEQELHHLAINGRLTPNQEKVGSLLRGFFEYYVSNGMMTHVPNKRGFDWGRDVLSLRTMGGLIFKQEKGWVGAKTVRVVIEDGAPPPDPNPPAPAEKGKMSAKTDAKKGKRASKDAGAHVPEIKEIRHRYLFAIEDPFELEHNVARTVTHNGICLLRDEIRRAWAIIRKQGSYRPGEALDMSLFMEVREKEGVERKDGLVDLMREIHGEEVVNGALA